MTRKMQWILWCGWLACILGGLPAAAQRPDTTVDLDVATQEDLAAQEDSAGMVIDPLVNFNLPLPTLGGKQFWTDHRWWHGWRIQYNSTRDYWRLIDPSSIRRGWGSKEKVLAELAAVQQKAPARVEPKEVVLLLHGLMRTSGSMQPIGEEIQRRDSKVSVHGAFVESSQRHVIAFTYASTRDPIVAHASALRELVENLPGQPRLRAVGHSMGNIVLRMAIAQWQSQGDPKGVLGRMDRVVMLGPPNQGSSFAKKLSQLGLFEIITGRSGMALGPQWLDFQSELGTPPCPFAVVAGDLSNQRIQNPWLPGPSDGIVTVEETKLDGMAEFVSVPVLHSFLMRDPQTVRTAVNFLQHGTLEGSTPRMQSGE